MSMERPQTAPRVPSSPKHGGSEAVETQSATSDPYLETEDVFPVPMVINVTEGDPQKKFPSMHNFGLSLPSINLKTQKPVPNWQAPLPSNSVDVQIEDKSCSHFHPMLLISSMERVHRGAIWVVKFSPDGKFLATAGEDGIILIWEVAPSKRDGKDGGLNGRENGLANLGFTPSLTQGSGPPLGLEISLLAPEPVQDLAGHKGDVIDLSWSESNFLLSASIDKTVRLWHVSRNECLQVFEHADFVTSVDFHPRDDQYFLSGGFDMKLRLWSVAKKKVKAWSQAPGAVTAARFTPSGHMAVAGLIKGDVYFYNTKGMQYYTQISCKNRSGPQSDGRKVTGLSFRKIVDDGSKVRSPDGEEDGGPAPKPSSSRFGTGSSPKGKKVREQLLVTTNDSRLRVVGLDDYCVVHKYKGISNSTMQIKATYCESGNYIISGSEEGNVHIWDSSHDQHPGGPKSADHKKFERSSTCASFKACKLEQPIVTSAVFVPSASVKAGLLASNLFPTLNSLDHLRDDLSSAMVVTSDYEGTLRVFVTKTCIDTVIHEAGPEGSIHRQGE